MPRPRRSITLGTAIAAGVIAARLVTDLATPAASLAADSADARAAAGAALRGVAEDAASPGPLKLARYLSPRGLPTLLERGEGGGDGGGATSAPEARSPAASAHRPAPAP